MKNIKLSLIAIMLLLGACSKKDSTTPDKSKPTTTTASGPFVAKVDGVQFVSDSSQAKAKYVVSTKMLQLIGQTSKQETIHFELTTFGTSVTKPEDWKPGTYDFDPTRITTDNYLASAMFTNYSGTEYVNWSAKWEYVKTGKIVIESNTGTHVKGTFYFDLVKQNNNSTFDSTNIKKVTEGSFDVDIVKY